MTDTHTHTQTRFQVKNLVCTQWLSSLAWITTTGSWRLFSQRTATITFMNDMRNALGRMSGFDLGHHSNPLRRMAAWECHEDSMRIAWEYNHENTMGIPMHTKTHTQQQCTRMHTNQLPTWFLFQNSTPKFKFENVEDNNASSQSLTQRVFLGSGSPSSMQTSGTGSVTGRTTPWTTPSSSTANVSESANNANTSSCKSCQ